MQGKTINARSCRWRGAAAEFKLDRANKPACVKVVCGGHVRLVGCSAAARWMGISRTTLYLIAEGGGKGFAKETVALVRAEYPQLLEG